MTVPTLGSILLKIRRLIGAPNPLQVSDTTLQDYINSFYNYDMPAQFRSLKLKDKYTFNTIAGVDTYAFDSEHYTTVQMPCYCAKREIPLFQDLQSFQGFYFQWQMQDNFAFGDGTPDASGVGYSGFTVGNPLLRSVNNNPLYSNLNTNFPAGRVQNILITANTSTGTINMTDFDNGDGTGTLYISVPPNDTPILAPPDGPGLTGAGTINYNTGRISGLSFGLTSIPLGNPIQIQYVPLILSIPLSCLFFQNQFSLRPVPDQGYTVEMVAYRQPSQAIANGAMMNSPELSEWWELIAVGAAKKFLEDSLDLEGAAVMEQLLKKRYEVADTRTYAQIGTQRVSTIYQDQLNYTYGAGGGLFAGGPQ
jgi:hypothetical protein